MLNYSQEKQQGSALQNLACTLHTRMTPDLLEVVGPFYTYYISAIFFPFHVLSLFPYTAFSLLLLIPEGAYAYKAFGSLHCVPLRLAWNYYKENQRNREAIHQEGVGVETLSAIDRELKNCVWEGFAELCCIAWCEILLVAFRMRLQ